MCEKNNQSNINKGVIAENIAANQFLKYGFEVFSPIVDNKGIDYLVRSPQDKITYIQVKSCCNNNYQFIRDAVFRNKEDYYVCFVRFTDKLDKYEIYLIPASAWDGDENNKAFVNRPKDKNAVSLPEHGISYTSKTKDRFQDFIFYNQIENLM